MSARYHPGLLSENWLRIPLIPRYRRKRQLQGGLWAESGQLFTSRCSLKPESLLTFPLHDCDSQYRLLSVQMQRNWQRERPAFLLFVMRAFSFFRLQASKNTVRLLQERKDFRLRVQSLSRPLFPTLPAGRLPAVKKRAERHSNPCPFLPRVFQAGGQPLDPAAG